MAYQSRVREVRWTAEQFVEANKKAAELALHALLTDGAHHKQWYLEQIVKTLGFNVDDVQAKFEYEKGIAP